MAVIKSGITSHGEMLPRKIAAPARRRSIPTYIGFRLKRNGPSVTRLVEVSPGLMAVCRLKKSRAADPPNARPNAIGASPMQRNGPAKIWRIGNQR